MNYLSVIWTAVKNFFTDHPLSILFFLVLCFGAPALVRGVFIVYMSLFGLVIIAALIGLLVFRHKVRKMQAEMRNRFNQQNFGGQTRGGDQTWGGFSGFGQSGFGGFGEQQQATDAGNVHVHKTSATPEKRISNKVGDYIDFEETKDKE